MCVCVCAFCIVAVVRFGVVTVKVSAGTFYNAHANLPCLVRSSSSSSNCQYCMHSLSNQIPPHSPYAIFAFSNSSEKLEEKKRILGGESEEKTGRSSEE